MNESLDSFKQLNIMKNSLTCGSSITMYYIGGKWKAAILWYLMEKKQRFTDLKKLIPQMTDRTLSIQLKKLEEDNIIKREVFTKKPPLKVEYSLTDFGKTLIPVLKVLSDWGTELKTSEKYPTKEL